MRPVKSQYFLLPVSLCGFLDTLSRATLLAFGYDRNLNMFSIGIALAVIYSMFSVFCPRKSAKILLVSVSLVYLASAFFLGKNDGVSNILPVFKNEIINGFAFVFLALAILEVTFLISVFILQRRGAGEVFVLCGIMMGFELLTDYQEVIVYAITHLIFAFGLYIQLFYLKVNSDKRVRNSSFNEFRVQGLIGFIMLLGAGTIFFTGMTYWTGVNANSKINAFQIKLREFANKNNDSYSYFWDKLDNFELRGKVKPSNMLVMSVKSSVPSYWRAESMDYYTGRGWKNSLVVKKANSEMASAFGKGVKIKRFMQEIALSPNVNSNVVFSAWQPSEIADFQGDLASDEAGNYYIFNSHPGQSYKVTSVMQENISESLINDLENQYTDYPERIKELYLQLPGGVTDRVKRLAYDVSKGANNQYEKVKLIEQYLRNNYPYELNISPAPEGRDVVDYFLFDLKKGYCTYHSTAMVVMLRSLGIPARWVKGFVSGKFNENTRAYEVTMADSHAWVEVFFPGLGWLPSEPTSGFKLPDNNHSSKVFHSADNIEESISYNNKDRYNNDKVYHKTEIVFIIAIIIIIFSSIISCRFFYGMVTGKKNKKIPLDKMEQIYQKFEEIMSQKGFSRLPFQTPLEYTQEIIEKYKDLSQDILLLTDVYYRSKYGNRALGEEDIECAERILKNIRLMQD